MKLRYKWMFIAGKIIELNDHPVPSWINIYKHLWTSINIDHWDFPAYNHHKSKPTTNSAVPSQVEAAYGAFKAKYFSVTLGAIRSELTSNTAFSEVLALETRFENLATGHERFLLHLESGDEVPSGKLT